MAAQQLEVTAAYQTTDARLFDKGGVDYRIISNRGMYATQPNASPIADVAIFINKQIGSVCAETIEPRQPPQFETLDVKVMDVVLEQSILIGTDNNVGAVGLQLAVYSEAIKDGTSRTGGEIYHPDWDSATPRSVE